MAHGFRKNAGLASGDFKNKTNHALRLISEKKDDFWSHERERRPLELFRLASRRVPAYKDFLRRNKIAPEKIKTFKDFQFVPPVSKKNYLREYPIEKLCWDGSLKKPLVWTSTSGSTGEPFYFPRGEELDWQSSVYHELFLQSAGLTLDESTVVIICFGMGVWIGGIITYEALHAISLRGYPITILTPGVNKKEIFSAIKNLGKKFDKIILCGYPPFLKDVADEAEDYGIRWRSLDIKMVFAAESFSEKFRSYIIKRTGIKHRYTDTANIYGSADLGTMAVETPLSILAREVSFNDINIYNRVFKDAHRMPTFAQYNPSFINFEAVDGEILTTGNNAIPLIRYAIGDRGGVMSFDTLARIFRDEGMSLKKEAGRAGIGKTISELPFVYLYERTDLSAKLFGAIIYPEHVKAGLENPSFEDYITGKFAMVTKCDNKQMEYLEINIELRPKAKGTAYLKKKIKKSITRSLLEKNAEYRNNANMMPDRMDPKIVFWKHEHPLFFKIGTKQRWVKRN